MLTINEMKALNADIMTTYETAFSVTRDYNKVINGDDAQAIATAEKAARDAIDAFNRAAQVTNYSHWLRMETPILAALQAGTVMQLALKVKNDKERKSVECEPTQVIVHLSDFDKYAAEKDQKVMNSATWRAAMEEARKVICGSCALESQEETDIKAFAKAFDASFALAVSSARADCGTKTIDARYTLNNCVRALQDVMDAVLYNDETGNGKNKYRVLRSDMNVVRLTVAKRGKSLHTISFPNAATFQKNVTDMLIRIVTNAKYNCEYTTVK